MRKTSGLASHDSAVGDGRDLDLLEGDGHVLPLSSWLAPTRAGSSLQTKVLLPHLGSRDVPRLGDVDAPQRRPKMHAGP